MTPANRMLTFRPDDEILDAMAALKERDGIPYSEQIRRALRTWLAKKGILKTDRKGAVTRKRS